MALSTYDELQASVLAWLARNQDDDDEVVARIPDFIRLGEVRFGRRLRVREMERRLQTPLNEPQETVPARFQAVKAAGIRFPGGRWQDLREVNYRALTRYWRIPDGDPYIYTLVGNEILFGPFIEHSADPELTADQLPTLEWVVYVTPSPLSDTNADNRVLDTHPDIYLYAALVEATGFLVSEQLATWVSALDDAIERANDAWVSAHEAPIQTAPSPHLIV